MTAFGVNAIVLPPGIETGFHYHDVQEELYFVHRGAIEMEFGDGSVRAAAGGRRSRAWMRPRLRKIRNVGDVDAVYLCAGGKDGYVGRDGRVPDEEQRTARVGLDRRRQPGMVAAPGERGRADAASGACASIAS